MMNTEEYLEFHKEMCDRARALSKSKNADYAAADEHEDDPFAVFRNFIAVERAGICSTETGFLVRLTDKFMRLSNLLKPNHIQKVVTESLQDTLDDILNYVILLAAYLKAKEQV